MSLFDFGFAVVDDDPIVGSPMAASARPNVSVTDRRRLAQLRVERVSSVLLELAAGAASAAAVSDVAFSHDGVLVAHTTSRGSLAVHKLELGSAQLRVALSLNVGTRLRRVVWDRRSDSCVWLLAAGQHLPVRFFDLSRTMGEPRATLESHWAVADLVQLTADTLALACSDGLVRVVDRRARSVAAACARARLPDAAAPLALAVSADGLLLAAGDSAAQLSLWDIRAAPVPLGLARLPVPARFDWLGFDDRRWPERVAFQTSGAAVGVWDTLLQRVAMTADDPTGDWPIDVTRCAFTRTVAGSGGSLLCYGSRLRNELLFADPSSWERPHVGALRTRHRVTCVSAHPDDMSNLLAFGTSAGSIGLACT